MAFHLVTLPQSKISELGESFSQTLEKMDSVVLWEGSYLVNARLSVKEIAQRLGISPNGLGIVVTLESFTGRAQWEVVEWLKARRSE